MTLLGADALSSLHHSRNLLALSGGVDSTALFWVLLEHRIPFEAALVNYKSRPQSDQEADRVAALCAQHGVALHYHEHPLKGSNFEARARQVRYGFFESLIDRYGFEVLLTAHQLNDRLEWHLMQLLKGAGWLELTGMAREQKRGRYRLIRPLLAIHREKIEAYLADRGVAPCLDGSNDDRRFWRNRIRLDYAQGLMALHPEGIARSFALMDEARQSAQRGLICHTHHRLSQIGCEHPLWPQAVDEAIKALGVLPTYKQRRWLEKREDGVLGRRVAVGFDTQTVWIAPFVQGVLPRRFREACRQRGIPPLIRPYLYALSPDIATLSRYSPPGGSSH